MENEHDPGGLQFDKAEFTGRQCAFCQSAIAATYYEFGPNSVCPNCAPQIERQLAKPAHAEMLRALLYGFGTALAGGAVMAIVLWWGWQLALLSIFAGQFIAKAMKHATGFKGSRALQIWAVALTYFACTISFAPVLVRDAAKSASEDKKAPLAPDPPATGAQSFIRLGIAVAFLTGICLAAPFLMITSGISGILNIIIIGVGLLQAWNGAAPVPVPLLGPYDAAGGEPA